MNKTLLSALTLALLLAGCTEKPKTSDVTTPPVVTPPAVTPPAATDNSQGAAPPEASAQPPVASE